MTGGGGGGLGETTDSTEILYSGADSWKVVESAALPSPLSGLRGVSIYNTVYMTGGTPFQYFNLVLKYN